MITYRKAVLSDAAELARIRCMFLAELSANDTSPKLDTLETSCKEYFERTLADDSFVAWLAVYGGQIVSTSGLSFYVVPPNNDYPNGKGAYIMNMYTLPDYRRQGLAKELFKRTVEEAKARNYTYITLNATDAGKPLYEKFGFTDVVGDMAYRIK